MLLGRRLLEGIPGENKYGYGELARVGDLIWIMDTYSRTLLRVDQATLAPEIVSDLDFIQDRMAHIAANTDSVFIAAGDRQAAEVVRFSGTTGDVVATYPLGPEGAHAVAATQDRLYVESTRDPAQIAEIDLRDGQTRRTFVLDLDTINGLSFRGVKAIALDS